MGKQIRAINKWTWHLHCYMIGFHSFTSKHKLQAVAKAEHTGGPQDEWPPGDGPTTSDPLVLQAFPTACIFCFGPVLYCISEPAGGNKQCIFQTGIKEINITLKAHPHNKLNDPHRPFYWHPEAQNTRRPAKHVGVGMKSTWLVLRALRSPREKLQYRINGTRAIFRYSRLCEPIGRPQSP